MGIEAVDNATTILGSKSELQPDGSLRILPESGGRTWLEHGFVHVLSELVVEVSKATRYVDLGPKKADYEQAGVLEYVVHAIDPDADLLVGEDQGMLVKWAVDDDGLYRSRTFPEFVA